MLADVADPRAVGLSLSAETMRVLFAGEKHCAKQHCDAVYSVYRVSARRCEPRPVELRFWPSLGIATCNSTAGTQYTEPLVLATFGEPCRPCTGDDGGFRAVPAPLQYLASELLLPLLLHIPVRSPRLLTTLYGWMACQVSWS